MVRTAWGETLSGKMDMYREHAKLYCEVTFAI